ncbi:MAG: MnhB domain-containing protein [Terriglobia bacterium]
MTRQTRKWVALPALAGFALLLLWGLRGVPLFGHYRGPYGDLLNARAVSERHITDVVTAVNFDYRGFDTLGEEFILFSSVMGVLLLLRQQRDETQGQPQDEAPQRSAPATSDAVRVLALGLAGPILLFGIDVVVHGQLTPGGGFQGGVILSMAPLLIYLAGDFETVSRITSHTLFEMSESFGAAGYILSGFIGIACGGAFLQNVLPLGKVGSVFSGGTIPLIDLSVGIEVGAGFVLLAMAFLEETLVERLRRGAR